MIQTNIKTRMILNNVGSSLLCVILAMGAAYFIVRYQNSSALNQRILQDKNAIDDRIKQNREMVRMRIEQDKIAVQEKMDQDSKQIEKQIEGEKKTAGQWVRQSGTVVEHIINNMEESLKSVVSQVGTDELYGKQLNKYNRDKNVEFLQTVLGGNKEQHSYDSDIGNQNLSCCR